MARKVEARGGKGENLWDDGADHENIARIHVRGGADGIQFIRCEYVKDGKTIDGPVRGVSGRGFTQTFEINHLNNQEYLISVKGCYDNTTGVIQTLQFETNLKSSEVMGFDENGTRFTLEVPGNKIIGFHGSADRNLKSLGAYFTPASHGPLHPSPPPSTEKLQGKGGDGGASWDDGVYDGVRKIYVGQGENGIAAVKFVYSKNDQTVSGEDRGKKTMLGYEEFALDYPSEYIMEVEGCYDKIFGAESEIITMLKFKTNVRTSPPFGLESTSSFVLGKEGHKIVGFHGKASDELHQIGVTVVPITK